MMKYARIKMKGKCRIYNCNRHATVLILHEKPTGNLLVFRECREHARSWEDVDDVVLIFEEEK